MVGQIHDWYPRQLPDSPLEILITGSNYVGLVLGHPVDQTVICIGPLMHAWQPLKSWVLYNPESNPVLAAVLAPRAMVDIL